MRSTSHSLRTLIYGTRRRAPAARSRRRPRGHARGRRLGRACAYSATGEASVNVLLPRRTAFVRKEAGFKTYGQVLATNIDYVWIVTAMTRELSARRVERYLSVAWESGAQPVIVLTKADLERRRSRTGGRGRARRCRRGRHRDERRDRRGHGRAPRSAVGASIGRPPRLVRCRQVDIDQHPRRRRAHRHAGNASRRRRTAYDDARRELVRVPSGGLVIDTPGLRELLAWDGGGADEVYADIETLMSSCRFSDCGAHQRARLRGA